MHVGNTRSTADVERLMQQLASLPKSKTDNIPAPTTTKNTNWNKNQNNAVVSHGRVNRTKGK